MARDGPAQRIPEVDVSDDMVEKARAAMLEESRKLNPTCGCEKRGSRQFCCSYHEGMDDGFDDGYALARSAVRDAVREYAPWIHHDVTCQCSRGWKESRCNCGLSALRKKYDVK